MANTCLRDLPERRDASGNLLKHDIGTYLCERFKEYFAEKNIPVGLKYFDPNYLIRLGTGIRHRPNPLPSTRRKRRPRRHVRPHQHGHRLLERPLRQRAYLSSHPRTPKNRRK